MFVLVLDSWGKPGAGILNGNVYMLGAYDQCRSVDAAKYCRATVVVLENVCVSATNLWLLCCHVRDLLWITNSGDPRRVQALNSVHTMLLPNSLGHKA